MSRIPKSTSDADMGRVSKGSYQLCHFAIVFGSARQLIRVRRNRSTLLGKEQQRVTERVADQPAKAKTHLLGPTPRQGSRGIARIGQFLANG